eukprot:73855_1
MPISDKTNPFTIQQKQHHTLHRSKTYEPNITKLTDNTNNNFFRQCTLRHLSFDDEDDDFKSISTKNTIPNKSHQILGIGKYNFNNIEHYELKKDRECERLNFDTIHNEISHLHSLKLSLKNQKIATRGLLKWFTCIIIGVLTGLCMVFVTYFIGILQSVLWTWYPKALITHGFSHGFAVFFAFSFGMAFIAGGSVLFAPKAAGSGIPEVKAYLNGSSIPSLFYMKTLFAKLIGITGAVCGSFMVGKEGPMVHSGAAIASGIGRASIYLLPETFSKKYLFGTDKDKRDLISCGAAAGVSAAFGAPIGGMLFALEEVSSFWRPGLNWRAFFCAATSNFTVLAVLACLQNGNCGTLQKTGLIDFVGHPLSDIGVFDLVNLFCFIILGVIGGLIGALFNHINIALTKWRNKYINNYWYRRLIEVLVISIITIIIILIVPYIYGQCTKIECNDNETCKNVVKYGHFNCKNDEEYNPLASLLQSPRESIIEGLFYYQSSHSDEWYPNSTLWIAFFCYFCVSVITYGIGIPSGLFVPIILIGSTFGHVMGKYFNKLFGHAHTFDVGTYSLLGAAALLGGTTRMTISLTVILVEITDDVYYLLPIILTIMIAKWIGDRINIPLYDAHIILKGVPFLEASLPKSFPTFVVAKDIMIHPVITLPRICSMKRVLHILSNKEFSHSAFPVVINNNNNYNNNNNNYKHGNHEPSSRHSIDLNEKQQYSSSEGTHHIWIGLILRSHIMAMFRNKCYGTKHDLNVHRLTNLQLEKLTFFHHNRQLESLNINVEKILYQSIEEEQKGNYLDFTPYMNLSPFTVKDNTPVITIYALFRSLGLRHLMVTNKLNEIVGIITAKELDEHHLEHLVHAIVVNNSNSIDEKTNFAVQRMAYLRGNDDQYQFNDIQSELQDAFTQSAKNNRTTRQKDKEKHH